MWPPEKEKVKVKSKHHLPTLTGIAAGRAWRAPEACGVLPSRRDMRPAQSCLLAALGLQTLTSHSSCWPGPSPVQTFLGL